MIDLKAEQLIPIRDVPKLLPPRPNGRRVHISAVYRWITRGVRGGVCLEVIRIGGSTYTSKEAVQRFAQGLSTAAEAGLPTGRAAASRRKQINAAATRVAAMLEGGALDVESTQRAR